MIDLQLIDYLTFCTDRHMGNYMVDMSLDKEGNVDVKSVKGYDNDDAFVEGYDANHGISTFPPVMSKSQKENLENMYKNRNRRKSGILAQLDKLYGKTSDEYEFFSKRLKAAIGAVNSGRVTIIDDKDWGGKPGEAACGPGTIIGDHLAPKPQSNFFDGKQFLSESQ